MIGSWRRGWLLPSCGSWIRRSWCRRAWRGPGGVRLWFVIEAVKGSGAGVERVPRPVLGGTGRAGYCNFSDAGDPAGVCDAAGCARRGRSRLVIRMWRFGSCGQVEPRFRRLRGPVRGLVHAGAAAVCPEGMARHRRDAGPGHTFTFLERRAGPLHCPARRLVSIPGEAIVTVEASTDGDLAAEFAIEPRRLEDALGGRLRSLIEVSVPRPHGGGSRLLRFEGNFEISAPPVVGRGRPDHPESKVARGASIEGHLLMVLLITRPSLRALLSTQVLRGVVSPKVWSSHCSLEDGRRIFRLRPPSEAIDSGVAQLCNETTTPSEKPQLSKPGVDSRLSRVGRVIARNRSGRDGPRSTSR